MTFASFAQAGNPNINPAVYVSFTNIDPASGFQYTVGEPASSPFNFNLIANNQGTITEASTGFCLTWYLPSADLTKPYALSGATFALEPCSGSPTQTGFHQSFNGQRSLYSFDWENVALNQKEVYKFNNPSYSELITIESSKSQIPGYYITLQDFWMEFEFDRVIVVLQHKTLPTILFCLYSLTDLTNCKSINLAFYNMFGMYFRLFIWLLRRNIIFLRL